MKLWRGISLTEAAILHVKGRIALDTFPEGAILPSEACADTTPPPPAGVYCFFSEDPGTFLLYFGERICLDVDPNRIAWHGTGRYVLYDMYADDIPPLAISRREAGLHAYALADVVHAPSREDWLNIVGIEAADLELVERFGDNYIDSIWCGRELESVPSRYAQIVREFLFGKEGEQWT